MGTFRSNSSESEIAERSYFANEGGRDVEKSTYHCHVNLNHLYLFVKVHRTQKMRQYFLTLRHNKSDDIFNHFPPKYGS